MKVVIEITSDDMTLVGLALDEAQAEALVVSAFKDICHEGELIRMERDGVPTYTVRIEVPPESEPEYEYVDNDNNPINEDGSDILDSDDIVMQEETHTYQTDTIWVIRDMDVTGSTKISFSEYYLVDNPFEEDENLVVVTSI